MCVLADLATRSVLKEKCRLFHKRPAMIALFNNDLCQVTNTISAQASFIGICRKLSWRLVSGKYMVSRPIWNDTMICTGQ